MITGGTGSFGSSFVKRYHEEHNLHVFSRDELKQDAMRGKYPDVIYHVGDIRDRQRLGEAMQGIDYVFHAAALKQVPSCEFFPMEAVKTNILGTEHVLDAAHRAGVKKVVCLSTDKAVYPINAMGISKAMMEKLAIAKDAVITRYGNVMRSRGSIIPRWEETAKKGETLKVTVPDMTRFLMSLDDSIDLVMHALKQGEPGDIFVKKAPACTMLDLAKSISDKIAIIGARHGEKMHESLISAEEMIRVEDQGDYFRIKPDSRDMNYDQFYFEGTGQPIPPAYSSKNVEQLNIEQIKEVLHGIRAT